MWSIADAQQRASLRRAEHTVKLLHAASGRRLICAQQVTNLDKNNQKFIYGAIAAPNAVRLA